LAKEAHGTLAPRPAAPILSKRVQEDGLPIMIAEGHASGGDIWQTICEEARAAIAADPVLEGSLSAAVFDHGGLGEAVVYQIGKRLGATASERTRFARVAREAFLASPDLVEAAGCDLRGIASHDPATKELLSPLLNFKGYIALQVFRVSNWLWRNGRTDLALLLQSESSDSLQVSIHPSATIGASTFLDHATGIIVGAFVQIGDGATILQNVTVGRTEGVRRAPRIGHGVLLSAGSTILGDISIGAYAKIGADAVVTHDVPEGCTAVGVPARLVNCPDAAREFMS
jgi:serine O-acetyltransferase